MPSKPPSATGAVAIIDDDKACADTRDTVSFLFRLKRTWEGAVATTGCAVLTAVIAILFAVIRVGF